jgi:hypothetical protein
MTRLIAHQRLHLELQQRVLKRQMLLYVINYNNMEALDSDPPFGL